MMQIPWYNGHMSLTGIIQGLEIVANYSEEISHFIKNKNEKLIISLYLQEKDKEAIKVSDNVILNNLSTLKDEFKGDEKIHSIKITKLQKNNDDSYTVLEYETSLYMTKIELDNFLKALD